MRVRRLLKPQVRSLVDRIVTGCAQWEAGSGDAHELRTTCRRLRSILRAYAPMFKTRRVHQVDRDLHRLMSLLGAVRDADVALDLLETIDPDRRDELDALAAASVQAMEDVRSWLSSQGGHDVLERLAAFAADVPWSRRARRPARPAVARTLDHERRRIRRRARRARHTPRGDIQDRRLHDVRRAVKRASDASASAPLGSSHKRRRREWREAQDVLGRHHDLVMLQEELRRHEADEVVHLEAVTAETESARADAVRTLRRLGR